MTVEVASQRLTVLCGPPAAGKSVLLRLLVGLEQPSEGRILIDDRDITDVPAAQRRIGYVPQSFALFPHVSVFDNIAYPLALQHVSRAEIALRVGQVAEILGISPLFVQAAESVEWRGETAGRDRAGDAEERRSVLIGRSPGRPGLQTARKPDGGSEGHARRVWARPSSM